MFPDKIYSEVAFPDVPRPVVGVWNALVHFLGEYGCLPRTFEVSQIAGHVEKFHTTERLKCSASEIEKLIEERSLTGFHVSGGRFPLTGVDYILSDAKRCGAQSTLRCTSSQNAVTPKNWDKLIENLLTFFSGIAAWQWHSRYVSWQTATVIRSTHERNFGQIPPGAKRWTKASSDGIGPDTDFVDPSTNPGRARKLLEHIYFYPTAEMWLGPHFWQYAKCTKEEALAADFFIEKRDTSNFLYLKCWPEPFTRPDGEQGRMQQRLWKLLFHEDCEWPPGSGGISDEPMYGPPELMPKGEA